MSQKKKIFFTYSDKDETQFTNICLHFSALKNKVELWYKDKQFPGDNTEEVIKQKLSESDILLHLLSVYSANDTTCDNQLEYSIAAQKRIILVLLSSYAWKDDNKFSRFEADILPEDTIPIDLCENFNEACTQIVQDIHQSVFGEKIRKHNNSRRFYWILASGVFLVGIFTSIVVYQFFNSWLISGIAFLLFICIDVPILLRLRYPTNISSLKI